MKPTSEELRDIFYSGFPAATSWQILDDLTLAIHNDYVSYQSVELISKENFYALQNTVVTSEGLGPQGKGHMALKEVAKQWLRRRYGINVLFESYFAGLHPDVRSEDSRFIIECGTTDPSCIPIFLNDPCVLWVGTIPYPFDEDTNLFLYLFRRGPNYDQWQREKLQTMRDIFQKFHRR